MFPFLPILHAAFVSLFLGLEYQDGTLRNKLIVGHSRGQVYCSCLLTSITGCFGILLAWALGAVAGIPRLGWFTAPVGTLLLAAALILLLTAICEYLELLEQEPQTEKAERYLAVVRERTDAMRTLTEELFRYCVITATADELRPEAVCLNDILEQSVAGFYGALSVRGITPEIRLPEEKVVRQLDAAALRRIFDNILSNAVKYSDGNLAVSLLPDGSVTFSNRAPALSRIQAGRLFDRFFTVEAARDSTGLGLSIARLLSEKMGGTITAEYKTGRLHVRAVFPQSEQK